MSGIRHIEEFVFIMSRENGGSFTLHQLQRLMRLARAMNTIQVRRCNERRTAEQIKQDARRELLAEAEARAICKANNCRAIISGEPRGSMVIGVPSGRNTSMGGDGIVVPIKG